MPAVQPIRPKQRDGLWRLRPGVLAAGQQLSGVHSQGFGVPGGPEHKFCWMLHLRCQRGVRLTKAFVLLNLEQPLDQSRPFPLRLLLTVPSWPQSLLQPRSKRRDTRLLNREACGVRFDVTEPFRNAEGGRGAKMCVKVVCPEGDTCEDLQLRVNLQKKQATNYRMGETTLSRREAVTAMCWGDSYESEILVGCFDGSVRLFSTEKGKFIESRDCQGGEGPFCGLAVLDGKWPNLSSLTKFSFWQVEIQVGPGVCRMRQNSQQRHRIATGGKENCLKIWDLHQPQEPVFRAKNVRHDWLDLRVPIWDRDMEFLPGSEKIVTCTGHHQVETGEDTLILLSSCIQVRIYDPSCPQRRPVLEVNFGEYPLTALSLTSDANAAVVGSSHGDVAVIDLRQGMSGEEKIGFTSRENWENESGLAFGEVPQGFRRQRPRHPMSPYASCGCLVYLKSRLNCLLLASREKWESEDFEPSINLQDEVKEEDDELWNSMEVVASKRKVDPDLGSQTGNPKLPKDPTVKKQKKMKKTKLRAR
ncbi:WD repeat-containing protein 74, partial [Ophiophagus hannah]